MNDEDERFAQLPPRSSSCEYIQQRNSKFSDHDMRKTIEACRVLKTFMYELGWGYLGWSRPHMHNLTDALSLHMDSLENLFLDLRHHGEVEEDGILYAPISLASFTRLKHVKINPVFLTGRLHSDNIIGDTPRRKDLATKLPELFPSSLERLCIANAQNSFQEVVAGLQRMLLRKHTNHPVLRELVLEGPWSSKPDYWASITELLAGAQREDVALITKDNRFPGKNDGFWGGLKLRWGMDDEFCWVELGPKLEPFGIFDVTQHFL